jgi:hypothetical protein
MTVSALMELDHLTDRLLRVAAADVEAHAIQLTQAKELIKQAVEYHLSHPTDTPKSTSTVKAAYQKARDALLQKVSMPDRALEDANFVGLDDNDDKQMDAYYSCVVKYGDVKLYYDVTTCNVGFIFRMTRGFYSKRQTATIASKASDDTNVQRVLEVMRACMTIV